MRKCRHSALKRVTKENVQEYMKALLLIMKEGRSSFRKKKATNNNGEQREVRKDCVSGT